MKALVDMISRHMEKRAELTAKNLASVRLVAIGGVVAAVQQELKRINAVSGPGIRPDTNDFFDQDS